MSVNAIDTSYYCSDCKLGNLTYDDFSWRGKYRNYPRCKNCQPEFQRQQRKALRKAVILYYGGFCVCCKETQLEFLVIDHIKDDGNEMRKEFGPSDGTWRHALSLEFPNDVYQVLCYNCNCAKTFNKKDGGCPHGNC